MVKFQLSLLLKSLPLKRLERILLAPCSQHMYEAHSYQFSLQNIQYPVIKSFKVNIE